MSQFVSATSYVLPVVMPVLLVSCTSICALFLYSRLSGCQQALQKFKSHCIISLSESSLHIANAALKAA
jgi:hypothetical protein